VPIRAAQAVDAGEFPAMSDHDDEAVASKVWRAGRVAMDADKIIGVGEAAGGQSGACGA